MEEIGKGSSRINWRSQFNSRYMSVDSPEISQMPFLYVGCQDKSWPTREHQFVLLKWLSFRLASTDWQVMVQSSAWCKDRVGTTADRVFGLPTPDLFFKPAASTGNMSSTATTSC
jgi:hypothetical protein